MLSMHKTFGLKHDVEMVEGIFRRVLTLSNMFLQFSNGCLP